MLVGTAALLSFHVFRSAKLSRKIFCNCISLRERGWGGSTIQLSLFAQICASDENKLNLEETTDQQQCQKLLGYVNSNTVCWHTSIYNQVFIKWNKYAAEIIQSPNPRQKDISPKRGIFHGHTFLNSIILFLLRDGKD